MFNWVTERFEKPKEIGKESVQDVAKDISEPVISFVETVKKQPYRFKLYPEDDHAPYTCSRGYILLDRKEDVKIECTVYRSQITRKVMTDFVKLTLDEQEYLYTELYKVFNKIRERKTRIERIRRDKPKEANREYLKRIYCK